MGKKGNSKLENRENGTGKEKKGMLAQMISLIFFLTVFSPSLSLCSFHTLSMDGSISVGVKLCMP